MNFSKTCWPVPIVESLFLPHFDIKENAISESYNQISFIARGAFGKVCKVAEKTNNNIYALKRLCKAKVCIEPISDSRTLL